MLTLLKPFIRPLVYILGLLIILYSIYYAGAQSVQKKWDIEKAEQKAEVQVITQVVEKEIIKYVDRVKVIREKGDVIIQKVPEFVTNSCDVPVGFVRIHDASVQNTDPGEPRASDAEASTVDLADVATTIVINYNTCNGYREQVIGLQNVVNTLLRR